MPVDLIYHTSESISGGVSPFDSVIMHMVRGQNLCIACPYLGLEYLKRMTKLATGWRLLTDVEAWLLSHAADSRNDIVSFISDHSDCVRHCKDLHAKVLIAGNAALTGSANFTKKGITGRIEVSTRFEDCDEVHELRGWFECVWEQAALPSIDDIRAVAESLPLPQREKLQLSLTSKTTPVKSRFSGGAVPREMGDAEGRLIERLRLAPDRRWAESWLDLANEIVRATGLSADDPRLVMSLPKTGNFLPIMINQRYVLTAFRLEKGNHEKHWVTPNYMNPLGFAVAELILPGSMKNQVDLLPGIIRHGAFESRYRGETEDNVPRFASFSVSSEFGFSQTVLDGLHGACIAERDKQRTSGFRRFHEPIVYRVVTDREFRESILDVAFLSN